MKRTYFLFVFISIFYSFSNAQKKPQNLVYVDDKGVLRHTNNKKEAQFFGVNYTVPFAYGYRSHKALGVDLEKAIDADVYHFARLDFNAFRVHVWDTEITDSLGNLKENEHLRLFDYLVAKLKERGIKIFLTPLAFWGNGYPEKDINTGSFSSKWNKQQVLVTENAIKAQEEYLKQLLKHVNPYTKQTYGQDPDIIALEINNEPHHSGTKQQAANYIDRMVKAVKNSGWTKPVYYNISESPSYAEPVANADIDGVSFQWYPTGLVANRSLKGNFLPNVDVYSIPFDTIPAYKNKSKMVYEFDAGDVYESYMYPAMARSFREAGFQWATHFAYDPMATAYSNTEYQTHYVNLAYTPSKAISLMIAGRVFNKLPRLRNYGAFPADTLFDVFRVSYKNALSEMNDGDAFYYSNSTGTNPVNISKLKKIAGVGSSAVVQYSGSGAYFLDKLEEGAWRLEVMPDAVLIRDPFEKASPKKEVTRIEWNEQQMSIHLPDLKDGFFIEPLNNNNDYKASSLEGKFNIKPGTYLITRSGKAWNKNIAIGNIKFNEFVAPQPFDKSTYLYHLPFTEVSPNKPFVIKAAVVGIDSNTKLFVELRHSANKWKTISLQRLTSNNYEAVVPVDMIVPGLLNYRIVIQKGADFSAFPGNHKGDPYVWDAYINETYQTFVAAQNSVIELFNPALDRSNVMLYNPDWRNNSFDYVGGEKYGDLILKASMNKPVPNQILGWQLFVSDKLRGRSSELNTYETVVVKLRSKEKVKLNLIDEDAQAFSTIIQPSSEFKEVRISLASLQKDSSLLLPRPYPHFHPLWFKSAANAPFSLNNLQKIEITFGYDASPSTEPKVLEVESIWLEKKK